MNRRLVLKNTGANFLGKLTNRAVRILLVPLQIRMLGEEAFGLLGLYALISGIMVFLDLGLSLTANREVASIAATSTNASRDTRDMIRTFELPYWLIGGIAGVGIVLSAGWLTDNWITAPTLPRETVLFSVTVMGLLFVARWPISLYAGVLYGLQRQVQVNALTIAIEVVYGIGSVVVLLLYPDVGVFFLWQLMLGTIELIGYVWLCWTSVRQRDLPRPRFRFATLRKVWRYAVGVNISSLVSAVFARSDSLILSKLLPISFLGYYSIAQRGPSLIGLASGAIIPATTPLMVGQYEKQDLAGLSRIYHRQARWLAFINTGVAFPMAAFAYSILLIWTQSTTVADAAWLSFAIIAAMTALETTSNSVNQLSLASGFTRPPIIIGMIEGIVVLFGTLILVPYFSIVGAALSWAAARMIRYVLYPIMVNRLVLHGEAKQWFFVDTLPFFFVGGLCFGGGAVLHRVLFESSEWLWIPIVLISGFSYITIVFAFSLIPEWRDLPVLSRLFHHRLA